MATSALSGPTRLRVQLKSFSVVSAIKFSRVSRVSNHRDYTLRREGGVRMFWGSRRDIARACPGVGGMGLIRQQQMDLLRVCQLSAIALLTSCSSHQGRDGRAAEIKTTEIRAAPATSVSEMAEVVAAPKTPRPAKATPTESSSAVAKQKPKPPAVVAMPPVDKNVDTFLPRAWFTGLPEAYDCLPAVVMNVTIVPKSKDEAWFVGRCGLRLRHRAGRFSGTMDGGSCGPLRIPDVWVRSVREVYTHNYEYFTIAPTSSPPTAAARGPGSIGSAWVKARFS